MNADSGERVVGGWKLDNVRTYDARMNFSLDDLQTRHPGVVAAPDTDVRAYLLRAGAQAESAP